MKNLKTLNQIKRINTLIVINLALTVVALCWINYGDFDVMLQNHLFTNGAWLVDKDEPVRKFIFYKFPKMLFGVGVVASLVGVVLGFKIFALSVSNKTRGEDGAMNCHPALVGSWRSKSAFCVRHRHRFLLIFLGLSIIPLIAGNIKKFTNVYCPNQLEIYGGDKPYVKIFESYPANFYQEKKGKCFPAGHAITGFTLMILFFALEKKSQRILGLASGLVLGWVMGFYQMAKGVHFFGDTLISMLVCFLLAALIARFYSKFSET